MKFYKTINLIAAPYGSHTIVNRGTENEYIKGTYTCKHGIATFYSDPTFASFRFVYNGRLHELAISEIPKQMTVRQLIIRAGKFVKQVVSESK